MRHFILSLILAGGCASSACALSVEQTVGVWKVDGEAFFAELMKQPEMANKTDEELAMGRAMFLPLFANMRATLSATGSVSTGSPDGKTEVHVYKSFTSTSATTALVVMTSAKGKEQSGIYTMANANELRITAEQGGKTMTIPMVRATAAASK